MAALLVSSVQAQPAPRLVEVRQLASSEVWLKLGHYESAHGAASGFVSSIHSTEFFLAPSGQRDPHAELVATVDAFNLPPSKIPDEHAQCRFPARLLWLRQATEKRLPLREDIACPRYAQWTKDGSVESISVVLATGFLGNPASFYGHTLLKLNYEADSQAAGPALLDESASFGAIMDGRNDDPVTYIFKSLTHGYDAGFSHIGFYHHDHSYGNQELRDLWEYRLALSRADTRWVVAHTWEVLGMRYTYEFFRGNCALRMAELIEIIEGVSITPRRPWIVPQSMIQKLGRAKYRKGPLLSSVVYHPSRQAKFYGRFMSLDADDRKLVERLVAGETTFTDEPYRSRPLASRHAVLDTLLDYHQFVNNPIENAPADVQRAYSAIVEQRYEEEPGESAFRPIAKESPHLGRGPGWVQFAVGLDNGRADIQTVRIRAAYYDALDFESGHVKYGALSMGDLQIDRVAGRVRLQRLDLVRIESVNAGLSRLAGDHGDAWRFSLGAEQSRGGCGSCLVARIQGDIGASMEWRGRMLFAGFVGAAAQTRDADQGLGFGRLSASWTAELSPALRMRVSGEYRVPVDAASSPYVVGLAEARWALSRKADVRLRYDVDRSHEVRIGMGFYW